MDFYEIFVRTPVNGTAARMLTSGEVSKESIDRYEVIYLIERLMRKRRLLNKAIGIKTKAQRKNLMYRINKGKACIRTRTNPRGVDEWERNGRAIHILSKELNLRNKEAREHE